jgi:hypothetical protein
MTNHDRKKVPICFIPKQIEQVERYAKRNGMLSTSQAIEKLALSKQTTKVKNFDYSFKNVLEF